MRRKLVFVLLAVSILAGCRATGRLYPVQGPLSTQTPTPILLAKVTGAFNSGNISVVLADGEVCKGRWATVPRVQVPKDVATVNSAPSTAMSSIWDTVYGSGFYVSHVLESRERPEFGNVQARGKGIEHQGRHKRGRKRR